MCYTSLSQQNNKALKYNRDVRSIYALYSIFSHIIHMPYVFCCYKIKTLTVKSYSISSTRNKETRRMILLLDDDINSKVVNLKHLSITTLKFYVLVFQWVSKQW